MAKHRNDGLNVSQIRTAEFARMSTSRQLSLWAIVRAQISSKKQIAAQGFAAAQKTLRMSPRN
ncbi:MAG: hypothetical protein ACHP7M_11070 [Burkholderiales bacterium]|jgi:hypothetical protein